MPSMILTLVFCCILALSGQACAGQAPVSPNIDLSVINVKEMTSAQVSRYGRELFRKGDYAEAAKVFQHILKNDCSNEFAQFHLQKIAGKGTEFTYLKSYLRTLPCPVHDFTDEDFLPASFYYEKDNDILIHQTEAYNKRYRNAREALSAKIDKYAKDAAGLEARVNDLTTALTSAAGQNDNAITDLKARLKLARESATQMDEAVASLKGQLAKATVERNRNGETRKLSGGTNTAAGDLPITIPGSAEDARSDLALTGLHAKFADIQARLNMIEQSLAQKNGQIKTISATITK